MKRLLQLVVTRWLARTPFGLVVLGVGWWFMRKRRGGRPEDRKDVLREPGRSSRNPYAWHGPAQRDRR
ncbi:hypothetical protein Sme01_55140 [Sphaerisporangium melleum]|uniref:Uncharacterized protein n=1 Tax=Sphaerisporangium melleum TaxID=321316 RepID=A0A917R6E1_9ACTN|nr:DUF6203 family protein [Sphaerisporangium melleum]GGK92653.1 hypothetical protein GCM10007964_39000 [Sphaerisporangium melleum]GII73038.1 hypothetical protein Sme01_55140 [Sphaerisporangium melleum]